MRVVPVSRKLDRTGVALLNVGVPQGLWLFDGDDLVVADGHRLWRLGTAEVLVIADTPTEVWPEHQGLVAIVGKQLIRWEGPTAVVEAIGRERPSSGQTAVVWGSEGFVYRRGLPPGPAGPRAIDVLGPDALLHVGPQGAVLVQDEGSVRAGAPGRTPRTLPVTILPPYRWRGDGREVSGVLETGGAAVIDLQTLAVRTMRGIPVSTAAFWRGATVVGPFGAPLLGGLVEASAARSGQWLAGPAGRIWNLATGEPTVGRLVFLGVTLPTPSGFFTLHWRATAGLHRGHSIVDGKRTDVVGIALDPDDTPVSGLYVDGAVFVHTALGEVIEVRGREVRRVKDAPHPHLRRSAGLVQTPVGPLEEAQTADHEGIRFAFNDDGWLLCWPEGYL